MKEYVNEITDSLQVNTGLKSLALCNILGNIELIKIVLSCNTTFNEVNLPCREVISSKDFQNFKAVLFHTTLQYKCDDAVPVSNYNRIVKVNILCNNSCDFLTTDSSKSLDASDKCIDDYGVTVITTFCDKLEVINLSKNKISDNGAITIRDCLKHNICLLELNLSRITFI